MCSLLTTVHQHVQLCFVWDLGSEDKISTIRFQFWEESFIYRINKIIVIGNSLWLRASHPMAVEFLRIYGRLFRRPSTPKLSSAVLVTAVFVHVIGFSSIHWSDGGVFYTGLWRACFLTVPGFHCRQDPYSAGESYHNRCAWIHHYPGNTHLIESVSAPCWFSNKHYFYRHNETWNKLYIKSLYLA